METVVEQLVDGGGGYMEPGVRRSIVDEHTTVRVRYPTVGESDIHHITDIFCSFWNEEPSAGFSDDACRVIEGGHVQIEHVPQTVRSSPYTVGEVQPTLSGLDRSGSFAVLDLIDGVVVTTEDDTLVTHLGVRDVGCERPPYTTAFAGLDKAILRTGVERILPFHELRMEDDVTLLAEGGKIFKSLPMNEVFGAGNTGCSGSGRGVKRLGIVMAFDAEDTIYPSVLMLREPHVIDIRRRGIIAIGHGDGFVPKPPTIDTILGLRDRKERLTVSPFHTCHNRIFAFKKDCSGVKHTVHHDALHQIRVGLFVKVIPPFERRVLRGENRVTVFGINTISALYRFVFARQ